MTAWLFSDNAETVLTAPVSTTPASGTSEVWTVQSTASLPEAVPGVSQFAVAAVTQVDGFTVGTPELLLVVETIDATHLLVERGLGASPVSVHPAGSTIANVITAEFLNSLNVGTSTPGANVEVVNGAPTVTLPATPFVVDTSGHPWYDPSGLIPNSIPAVVGADGVTLILIGA